MAVNEPALGSASQASILVEAMLDESGAPPCDPPDNCPVCVLVTPQRSDESRQAWLTRICEGAFGLRAIESIPTPEPPTLLIVPSRSAEARPMSVSEDALREALADLKAQERDLSRQLMKVRGGIEAIERLRSSLTAEKAGGSTAEIIAPSPVIPPLEPAGSFPEILREYRIRARMSQVAVAKAIGANPATVCSWESGKNTPRRDGVLKLVTALSLSTDQSRALLTAAGYAPRQQRVGVVS